MAAIASLETGYYKVPLATVLTDSTHGVMREFGLITVRVRDSEAAEGVGYTYTLGRNAGAVHQILAREIAEIAEGQDADLIEALWSKVWWQTHYGGRGGPTVLALSAFDIALWDLKAKRAGLPLWKLLGGHDPRVPCYAGGIDLNLALDELLAAADANIAKGFRALKMKVGRARLAEDVERVAKMREHLGEGFPLMVDANMGWTADEAIRAARAFAGYDLTWLEEPISPDDIVGHARVLREGGLPLAAGENLRTIWEFRHLIAAGGVTYPEPDVTNCGGVTAFMKVAHLAECFNLPVTSHGAHDLTVHLLAAAPNRSFLEAHGFSLDAYLSKPLVISEGFAIAPERIGNGIAFDWAALGSIRVED